MSVLLHLADRVLNRPLMIHPDKLTLIASILDGRIGIDSASLAGKDADNLKRITPAGSRFVGHFEPIDPKNPAAGRKPYRTTGDGVAIIPVLGSLVTGIYVTLQLLGRALGSASNRSSSRNCWPSVALP